MVLINLIQAIKLKTYDEKKLWQDLSTIKKMQSASMITLSLKMYT